jgi:hypothetical protein
MAEKPGITDALASLAGHILGYESVGLRVRAGQEPHDPIFVVDTDTEDGGSLMIFTRQGRQEGDIVAKTMTDGPSGLHVRRRELASHIQLNVFPDGRCGILLGAAGVPAALAIQVDPESGAPEILLGDRAGTTRAALRLTDDGSPEIVFYDAEGTPTWRAGPGGPEARSG